MKKTVFLLLLGASLLLTSCVGGGIKDPSLYGAGEQKLELKFIVVKNQDSNTLREVFVPDEKRYTVVDGDWLEFRFQLSDSQGNPVVGRKVSSSSEDKGGITIVQTDSFGTAIIKEPVGGKKSTLGPVTKVIEDASMRFRAEGGGEVLIKFKLLPKKESSVPIMTTPETYAVTITPVSVPTIKVVGVEKRVKAVSRYLLSKGVSMEEEFSNEEVLGTLKGKPWPGVQVKTGGDDNAGVFVPISNKALEEGLCSDQKTVLNAIISSIVKTPKVVSDDSTQFCNQTLPGRPTPPFRLVADKEKIILTYSGQSEEILFWVEDSQGHQIFFDKWQWVVEDGVYVKRQPKTNKCQKGSHLKIWDNDPATGLSWLPHQVRGTKGEIKILVSGEPAVSPVVVEWEVSPK